MDEICGARTTVDYGGRISGNVGMMADLMCQRSLGHLGNHETSRYFGHIYMTAKWA